MQISLNFFINNLQFYGISGKMECRIIPYYHVYKGKYINAEDIIFSTIRTNQRGTN